jgi:hypothetical protein
MTVPRIGGSFAPPIHDRIDKYETLAHQAPAQIGEAMLILVNTVEQHLNHPRSSLRGSPHPVGSVNGAVPMIVPLQPEVVQALDEHIPWREELDMFSQLFDRLDPVKQKDLRDAAFHLLWYANELYLDREPLTADML